MNEQQARVLMRAGYTPSNWIVASENKTSITFKHYATGATLKVKKKSILDKLLGN